MFISRRLTDDLDMSFGDFLPYFCLTLGLLPGEWGLDGLKSRILDFKLSAILQLEKEKNTIIKTN